MEYTTLNEDILLEIRDMGYLIGGKRKMSEKEEEEEEEEEYTWADYYFDMGLEDEDEIQAHIDSTGWD